jgi:hypothetical protein
VDIISTHSVPVYIYSLLVSNVNARIPSYGESICYNSLYVDTTFVLNNDAGIRDVGILAVLSNCGTPFG